MQAIEELATAAQAIVDTVGQVVVGKPDAITCSVIALLCRGHILIEDVPGVGKTALAKTLAQAVGCTLKRIQCTPDLLPSDVTGTSIYNPQTGAFAFQAGPIMSQIVLADELNRATAKTQAALLEAMEEQQVTVDGNTYPLPDPFTVLATQNPLDFDGTFPLPEAQLDRFTLAISLGYPSAEDEMRILANQPRRRAPTTVRPVITPEELVRMQAQVDAIYVHPEIHAYIVAIAQATRAHPDVALGVSPRGSLALCHAAQARAALLGRAYVLPDDVKFLTPPVLAHRIGLTPGARARAMTACQILADILRRLPLPANRAGGHASGAVRQPDPVGDVPGRSRGWRFARAVATAERS